VKTRNGGNGPVVAALVVPLVSILLR